MDETAEFIKQVEVTFNSFEVCLSSCGNFSHYLEGKLSAEKLRSLFFFSSASEI